ncbi:MAG: hypothetical protein ACRDQZ_10940 [Mycobacteriales bacterium]
MVWTGRRTAIFDGIPPTSNNPQGVNFASAVFRNVGCYSPKSIVQTPHGVIFLGSDGHFYMIRGLAGPERIGTAVWPIFRGMLPRQMRQCAATWTPKDYYQISYPEMAGFSEYDSSTTFVAPFFGNLDVQG